MTSERIFLVFELNTQQAGVERWGQELAQYEICLVSVDQLGGEIVVTSSLGLSGPANSPLSHLTGGIRQVLEATAQHQPLSSSNHRLQG